MWHGSSTANFEGVNSEYKVYYNYTQEMFNSVFYRFLLGNDNGYFREINQTVTHCKESRFTFVFAALIVITNLILLKLINIVTTTDTRILRREFSPR